MRTAAFFLIAMICGLPVVVSVPHAHAGPVAPRPAPPVIGDPDGLAAYWHDQRWTEGDYYACALYAQASVLESLGYDFATELDAARELGLAQGWYVADQGVVGLGQALRARGVVYRAHGSPAVDPIPPERALWRLELALRSGRYVLVNINAQALRHYRGSAIVWHTLWITGLRLAPDGTITHVIANDSYHGPAVAYPVAEFLAAWGDPALNFYGIFVEMG